jgi:hypothetical protein
MKKDAAQEWEKTIESGYKWPNPERIKIYIYPAQLKMIEEISRVWKIKKRDIFFEAIQAYIGYYAQWKEKKEGHNE